MFTPQGIILVIFGIMACFMGYSLFKSMLPLWGFLLGGWFLLSFGPSFIPIPPAQNLVYQIGLYVVGGLIGAVIAVPLYFVIIFFSGAALGALAGVLVGALIDMGGINSFSQLDNFTMLTFPPQPSTLLQFVLMVIFGLILGLLALNFQKFMITASSAFVGAAALVGGLSGVISSGLQTSGIGALLIMAWMVLGFVGLFVQFQVMGDEV